MLLSDWDASFTLSVNCTVVLKYEEGREKEAKFSCTGHFRGKAGMAAHLLLLLKLTSKKYGSVLRCGACIPQMEDLQGVVPAL